ncbi:pentapeptide repeat-containing protein [Priestia flexa]
MGRGNDRRKQKLKLKRQDKRRRGIKVPFTLSNVTKKMNGRSNEHQYKTNIHNLIFNDARFRNIRYSASNITYCKFSRAKLVGIDFIYTNLKKSVFKESHLEDVVFFGVNLKDADFSRATFKNVYFINTNTKVAKNLNITNAEIKIINNYPASILDKNLKNILDNLVLNEKVYKHRVLHVNKEKVNKWFIELLLNEFTQKELYRALRKLDNPNRNTDFLHTIVIENIF